MDTVDTYFGLLILLWPGEKYLDIHGHVWRGEGIK